MDINSFCEEVWEQGRTLYRDMPWRDNTEPYYVLVSELMLQQTQVDRVIPKFNLFMRLFPGVSDLARAPLADVLTAWSGLGYNRRAKYLHEAAKKIMTDFGGVIPDTHVELTSLPGVGPNTAGAIRAYSFNQPAIFIETNVRTVYFHHFFEEEATVSDTMLREAVEKTIDIEHPREWFWALMDYGSFLKRQGVGRIAKSSHYRKQTPLKGSLREVRGLIIKALADRDYDDAELRSSLPDGERYVVAVAALKDEGLVVQVGNRLHLAR
jgi:A/G-specific adenine glycosylase